MVLHENIILLRYLYSVKRTPFIMLFVCLTCCDLNSNIFDKKIMLVIDFSCTTFKATLRMKTTSHSQFTEEQLKDYQELTYFTQKEILHCHKRFSQLDPDAVKINANAKLPSRKIMTLPELRVNPFKDRICKVFSSSKDGELTFEDFLDMMSVFSENAPKSVKVEYAFRIYDFNEDDYICENDLKRVIQRLCGEQRLSDDNVNALIQKIFEESDLDDDSQLSFAEFEHVISKAPDFVNSFRIRV